MTHTPEEPEEVLSGTAARTRDHEPSDSDDRPVQLDDPSGSEPPIDEADKEPSYPEDPSAAPPPPGQ